MHDKLTILKKEILENLDKVKDIASLRALEIKYLGRKGALTEVLRSIARLGEGERKTIGTLANDMKKEIENRIEELKLKLGKTDTAGFIDVTLPGEKICRGHLHPMTQVISELEEIFASMGFMSLDGPELESDFYNFTALNVPPYHPARDMQDTFYIDQKNKQGEYDQVMRTQTSPVQIRAMRKYGAPLRCIVPGKVYRNEATDAVHDNTFYQIEGLMIDKHISISNLISIMKEILTAIFKQPIEIRVRPGYFPFVEPGLEVDIKCTICKGPGCPSCKHSGWLEMVGAGMVHPNVLRFGGIDPDKYTGYAFGVGLTRLLMMKHGIHDIRLFNSADLRFLEQF